MGGAVERSGKSGQAHDLAEGAGQTVPLKRNENFERRPHHTPGPWSVSGVRTRESGQKVLQIYAADGKVYALVLYSDLTPAEHVASHADARLIAAAPALYDAIRNSDDEHWTPAMRAAMRKVEGV